MTHRLNAALAAIAFACLSSAAPALAESPVQLHVSTRGIDLDSAAGLAELGRRVHASAVVACADDRGIGRTAVLGEQACRDELDRVGETRIAELMARRHVMVASASGR